MNSQSDGNCGWSGPLVVNLSNICLLSSHLQLKLKYTSLRVSGRITESSAHYNVKLGRNLAKLDCRSVCLHSKILIPALRESEAAPSRPERNETVCGVTFGE